MNREDPPAHAESVARPTRELYSALHERQIQEGTSGRLPGYLDLLSISASGMRCLDVGAGDTARDAIRLLSHGAGHVTLIDVGRDWMPSAAGQLATAGYGEERFSLRAAEEWPIAGDAEAFDLVTCNGVIHHVDDDRAMLHDIASSLKPGGYLYFMVMGKGGIVRDIVMGSMRSMYTASEDFRAFMNLPPEQMVTAAHAAVHRLAQSRDDPLDAAYAGLLDALVAGSDVDLMLTLKDRVNSPIYRQYDMSDALDLLASAGLVLVERVYPKPRFSNLRAILEPVYAAPEDPLSRLLMGSGNLHLLATKPSVTAG